jgi:hypothetical protein
MVFAGAEVHSTRDPPRPPPDSSPEERLSGDGIEEPETSLPLEGVGDRLQDGVDVASEESQSTDAENGD